MSKRFTYWNSFSSAPAVTPLFDAYGGASVGYSLRKLATSTVYVVRVRRSSDNLELDFSDTDITDGTLTAWTGANDGLVSIWYDQSGNDNNLTQTTTTLQPKLVSVGVVITDGGKPAIDWGSTGKYMDMDNSLGNNRSIFYVNKSTTLARNMSFLLGDSSKYDYHPGHSNDGYLISSTYAAAAVKNGTNYINSILTNFSATPRPFTQSLLTLIHAASASVSNVSKDRTYGFRSWQGTIQELVIYPTDETVNRIGIEDNINAEYTIY